MARSRAYRWGEDGLHGICDDQQILCFAPALWNERDPILKERLFGLTNTEVTVTFWTTDGSAKAGLDYRSVTNMLTFAGGQTNRIVLVPLIDDGLAEGNETVVLHLTNSIPGSAVGGSSTGTLTIVDDECALQFASATYSVNEYAGVATVVVQRTGGTVNPVSVHYSTRDGTATSTGPKHPHEPQHTKRSDRRHREMPIRVRGPLPGATKRRSSPAWSIP